MSTSGPESDVIEAIARRIGIVELLVGGRMGRRDLVEELGVSRSTVDRAVRELESLGLVEGTDGGLDATLPGRLVAREYRRFAGTVGAVADAQELLVGLPSEAAMSAALLRGATVRRAEPSAVHRPLQPVRRLVRSASRYRGFSVAVTDPEFRRVFREACEAGTEVEFVVAEAVARHLRTEHAGLFAHESFEVFVHDDLPYGLGLGEASGDAEVAVVVYGPEGELRGTISNDASEAVAWADALYRRYRAEATPL